MSEPSSLSNQLLIALPQLDDPNFARSVTLICRHDEEGAMGVTINRASDYHLAEVLAHEDDGRDWDSTYRVSATLKLTTSRDILASMANGEGPARALLALGCAGWSAGQLEEELAANAWLTVPTDDSILFDVPLEQRWTRAAHLLGVDLRLLTDYAGRA
jgi:putative transcriptional regulator